MIIRKLQLSYFGKFSEAVFEFRRGLNLVVGPNEAGKSTIMEAIPAILFGQRDKSRYRSWGRRSESTGCLTLEQSGGILKIERNIESNRIRLEKLDSLYQSQDSFSGKVSPQGRSSEARVYSEILEETFGLSDELLLRASLFFGQGQLEIPVNKNFPARIKSMISGFGSVDYDQVLHSLREDLFTLTRHNPWGKSKSRDRVLELTQASLDSARSQLELLQVELNRAEDELCSEESLASQRDQLAEEIVGAENYLAWLKRFYALEKQRNALVEKLDHIDSELRLVKSLEADLAALDADLNARGVAQDAAPELPASLFRHGRLGDELLRIDKEGRQLQGELQSRAAPTLFWPLLGTFALVCVAAVGFILRPGWLDYLWYGTGATAALSWLLVYRRRLLARIEKAALRKQLAALGARKRALQAERLTLEQELAAAGVDMTSGVPNAIDPEAQLPQQLLLRRGELFGELKARERSAALETSYHQLIRDLALLDARLDGERAPVAGKDLAADEIGPAEEELLSRKLRLTELDLELSRLSGTPGKSSTLRMEVVSLEERCQELSERIEIMQRRVAALQLGHDVLLDTVREYREGALVRLGDAAAQKLKILTTGRHQAIRFDDDLKAFLKASNGSWQPLELFSCGTRDLVYLVIRLVFQEMIFPGRKLPLLLDDPFVNLDQERRQKMLVVLEKLSLEHQVIVFSHDPKLLGKAARERWHVLPLDQQQSRTQPAEEDENDGGQLHLL